MGKDTTIIALILARLGRPSGFFLEAGKGRCTCDVWNLKKTINIDYDSGGTISGVYFRGKELRIESHALNLCWQ